MSAPIRRRPPLLLAINAIILLIAVALVPLALAATIVYWDDVAFSYTVTSGTFICIFGVSAYRSVFSRKKTASWVAAACYFFWAGVNLLGLMALASYLLSSPETPDLIPFSAVALGLTAHGVLSGVLSLRWGRRLAAAQQPPNMPGNARS